MGKRVVIIGGGIGGLTTASLLCKEGYQVTVLEKHYKIGGGLHTFKRNGAVFETGIHYVSGFQSGGILQQFYTYLGVFDHLKLKPLDSGAFDVVRVAEDQTEYPIARGKENFIRQWASLFPEEAQNIRNYTEAIYAIADRFYLCNMRMPEADEMLQVFQDEEVTMPVGAFIERYIKNPRLQQLIAWNNALYAGNYTQTPVYVHAIINRFFIEGASRFVDGSQQLADALCNVITAHGGEIHCGDGVQEIISEDREIQYVRTEKGKCYEADLYVSSLHPAVTVGLLPSSELSKAYRNRLQTNPNTYSAFVFFAKMKKGTFPYLNSNVYCADRYEDIWNVKTYKTENWPVGMMVTMPPKTKEEDVYADTVIINCIMNFDDVRRWEDTKTMHRGEEYEAFKRECEAKVLTRFESYFPGVTEKIEHYFSATPLTIRDYTGSKEGSLYGFVKECDSLERAQVSPATKIRNLYLTGQNINLHGILGVPLNSMITVAAITGGIAPLIGKVREATKMR